MGAEVSSSPYVTTRELNLEHTRPDLLGTDGFFDQLKAGVGDPEKLQRLIVSSSPINSVNGGTSTEIHAFANKVAGLAIEVRCSLGEFSSLAPATREASFCELIEFAGRLKNHARNRWFLEESNPGSWEKFQAPSVLRKLRDSIIGKFREALS